MSIRKSIKQRVRQMLGQKEKEKGARKSREQELFEDLLVQDERAVIDKVRPYTMTSKERLVALMDAVRYIERYQIEGAIVECGVWRGGSMMAVAETLISLDRHDRQLYLFDTFEGMPPPTPADRNWMGVRATRLLEEQDKATSWVWAVADLADVMKNLGSTGYPTHHVAYIKGRVEDTLERAAPEKIALLRLDTDWYESTRFELEQLFPRVVQGGIVIVDDYGHWKGCKKAVDEYFDDTRRRAFLSRIDYTGRLIIKQG